MSALSGNSPVLFQQLAPIATAARQAGSEDSKAIAAAYRKHDTASHILKTDNSQSHH